MAVEPDPIDALWNDRPAPPLGPVTLHDVRFAGEEAVTKLARIRPEIASSRPMRWSSPIRTTSPGPSTSAAADVAHTPLPLAFAIVPREGRPALYVDGRKLSNEVRSQLEALADVREPAEFVPDLAALGKAKKTVRLDQATAADALARMIVSHGGKAPRGADPITLMKAVKNSVEIEGARAAHRRDGAAVARFLAWFDREAPAGKLTEIDAVEALESFRRETGLLKDVSFPTISGAGPNGAIVHYRVTRKTNRVDQAGRAVPDRFRRAVRGRHHRHHAHGRGRRADAEMRDRFTRVLKGHIAIARAVFPEGTTGAQLDPFARQSLWEAGLDFDHGTGHGVGSYLSVHEGPARISKLGTVALKRGMILSNEPGYYKTGAYGIRIENLVLVTEGPAIAGAEKPLNAFETLTLAPIDLRLVDAELLTAARWPGSTPTTPVSTRHSCHWSMKRRGPG